MAVQDAVLFIRVISIWTVLFVLLVKLVIFGKESMFKIAETKEMK